MFRKRCKIWSDRNLLPLKIEKRKSFVECHMAYHIFEPVLHLIRVHKTRNQNKKWIIVLNASHYSIWQKHIKSLETTNQKELSWIGLHNASRKNCTGYLGLDCSVTDNSWAKVLPILASCSLRKSAKCILHCSTTNINLILQHLKVAHQMC